MANIQKKTNSKGQTIYRFRVSCGYNNLGHQIVRSMTWVPDDGMTPKQMEKEANRQAFIFEEACRNERRSIDRVKFKDLAEEWFKLVETTKEMKISTIQRYKTCTERTYKAFGNAYLDRITFRDIQMFIVDLSRKGVNQRTGEGLSQKSQKHHLTFISDVMRYAIKCGLIKDNPCNNVSTIKTENQGKDIYSLDEMRLILQRISKKAPTEYKIFLYLASFCGLRRGEILVIEYKDIDLDKGTVSILRTSNYNGHDTGVYTSTPKTQKSNRILVLPKEVLKLIPILQEEQREMRISCGDQWRETDRLLIGWNGNPIHPNTPYNWLSRFCEEENLPFKGIHSFRHAFATEAITSGVDVSTVSAILGHSTPMTTLNIYTHAVQSAKARALNIVAERIRLE